MNCYKCATPVPDNSRFCLSCGADLSGENAERTLAVEADPELLAKLQAELGSDFIIERELGRGGMAIVFLARDAHLGRKVAIKMLPPELTFGTGLVERFKREARTSATLDHPHIIPIHRVSTGGTLFWYVMKYLEGESLAAILEREGPLALDRAAEILGQVAKGLEYAHKKRVIHRDIKPANIVIDGGGWVTVTDFGIAKSVDTQSMTGSGSMIGTPYYMSPEQCSGLKVTGASDQYSLGVVAYQMVSGHLPFTGQEIIDIIKKHCMDPVPPLSVLRPNLPPALIAVVERALAKAPEERFATVVEFAAAFGRAASGAPAEAGTTLDVVRPSERPSDTALVSLVPGVLRTSKGLGRSRLGKRIALGAAGGAVLAGVAAVMLWHPWAKEPPRPVEVPAAQPTPPVAAGVPPAESTAARPDTTPHAAPSPAVLAAPATAAPAPPATAVLVLRGAPRGAQVTLDGRTARGARFNLTPGTRHIVVVTAEGFGFWVDTLRPQAGATITRTVRLVPSRAQAAAPAAQAPSLQPQAAPTQPAPTPPAPPAAPAAATVGYLTVGTRPLSVMTINGRPVPNPASRYEVPPGTVRLHFAVTDSTGSWSVDTSVTIAAGEAKNLGRIPLVHRR